MIAALVLTNAVTGIVAAALLVLCILLRRRVHAQDAVLRLARQATDPDDLFTRLLLMPARRADRPTSSTRH